MEPQVISAVVSVLKEQVENLPKEKEMLDKSDPDNYEAIYAITGFNDALRQTRLSLEKKIKELENINNN